MARCVVRLDGQSLADYYPQSAHTGRMNKSVGNPRSNMSTYCPVRTSKVYPPPPLRYFL